MRLYQELRLESFQNKRKLRRFSLFYKIYKDQSLLYLYKFIPANNTFNYLLIVKEIAIMKMKHKFFKNSFFPATITEWNDLDYSLRSATSINVFKQNILKFIRLGFQHLQPAW